MCTFSCTEFAFLQTTELFHLVLLRKTNCPQHVPVSILADSSQDNTKCEFTLKVNGLYTRLFTFHHMICVQFSLSFIFQLCKLHFVQRFLNFCNN